MRTAAIVLLLCAVNGQAWAATPAKLAVMPLVPKKVDPTTVGILDELLVNEVAALKSHRVIGIDDINAMLGLERMKDALGCDDVSCAAEIGGALGVTYLVSGSVAILGKEVIVSLRLIHIATQQVENRAQVSARNDESAYRAAIKQAVAELFGRSASTPQPPPRVAASDREARAPAVPTPPVVVPKVPSAEVLIETQDRQERFSTVLRAGDGKEHSCTIAYLQPCNLNVALGAALFSARLADRDVSLSDELLLTPRGAQLQLKRRGFNLPTLVAGLVAVAGSGVALLLFSREPTHKDSSTADDFGWEPKKQAYFASTLILATTSVVLGLVSASGEQLVVDYDESAETGKPRPR